MTAPTHDDVLEAAELISPHVRRTPVLDVEVAGTPVTLKLELLQHAGSFKARGTFTSVLGAEQRPSVLVAASGGNHGLAVAYVGRALGITARIFVPAAAPRVKVDAIAGLGAEVHRGGATYAEALLASREAGAEPEALVLHAYDAKSTVAGQGTLGLEIAEQVPDVDTVLVAVGGGGLLAGVTLGLPGGTRMVAVEPATCPTLAEAIAHGGPVDVSVGGVAADALGASRIGTIAWDVVQGHDVRSVLVEDEAVLAARRWLWQQARVAAEPAGAAALAALLSGRYVPTAGERICVVICGGNADPAGL